MSISMCKNGKKIQSSTFWSLRQSAFSASERSFMRWWCWWGHDCDDGPQALKNPFSRLLLQLERRRRRRRKWRTSEIPKKTKKGRRRRRKRSTSEILRRHRKEEEEDNFLTSPYLAAHLSRSPQKTQELHLLLALQAVQHWYEELRIRWGPQLTASPQSSVPSAPWQQLSLSSRLPTTIVFLFFSDDDDDDDTSFSNGLRRTGEQTR